ncbi:hypothetical protein [Allorhodopirellula solitaria]|uniref:Uncharacterized protein n=1 Tax=Allorhodopirellula solitaria TaxID=2527987 RepID=A0A5C5XTJ9_9BACT|nr:hypothetical protein [Allorhodopirellula solitaria]TWT65345.1 hypothetical protein CA85_32570 [Allorhodopirellula solitaria]
MRLPILLVVFSLVIVGRSAGAGVIVDMPVEREQVAGDGEPVLVIVSSADDPVSPPLEIDHRGPDSMEGLATMSESSVAPSATLPSGIAIGSKGPLLWRVEWGNFHLPPPPDLDGLLKPS